MRIQVEQPTDARCELCIHWEEEPNPPTFKGIVLGQGWCMRDWEAVKARWCMQRWQRCPYWQRRIEWKETASD